MFKGKQRKERTFNDFDEFMQDLYELQGQINTYSLVAKEVFNIESEDDAKFKQEFHEGIKEVEYSLSLIKLRGQKENTLLFFRSFWGFKSRKSFSSFSTLN